MASSINRPAARRIAPSLGSCSSKRPTRSQLAPQQQLLAPFYLQRAISIASRRHTQHTPPWPATIPQCRPTNRAVGFSYRSNSTTTSAGTSRQTVAADEYIQELQDLYEIAQDEVRTTTEEECRKPVFPQATNLMRLYSSKSPPNPQARQQSMQPPTVQRCEKRSTT